MHVLDKMSVPGWEFKTDYIEQVFWILDQCVCSSCKVTKAEYEGITDENLGDDINPFTFTDFRPETYDSWSVLEKVEWLLGTACGCEFDFYDEAEGSSMTFVEIKS